MDLRLILLNFVMIALAAIPTGEAQLRLGAVRSFTGAIEGLLGPTEPLGDLVQLVNGVFTIIQLNGTVFCSPDSSNNGTPTQTLPPFPNAQAQLRCGNNNDMVATATTNGQGQFKFAATPSLQDFLIKDCKVSVTTPLSNCNASLPSTGSLASGITRVPATGNFNERNVIVLRVSGFSLRV
ncbi:OLC1v1013255C1 [Oldenlandia corymbosa var. corymbosa]|uniref:OLC1v1013255C1 n=1 Tax=Oldenlandia corymbosa var. corymbosa TaxID=529605 RepID=A0AAV1DXT5_OLDCO|nr:OLC1v1013255C1 [Oldenlandia corymbosa var. corymbosa]